MRGRRVPGVNSVTVDGAWPKTCGAKAAANSAGMRINGLHGPDIASLYVVVLLLDRCLNQGDPDRQLQIYEQSDASVYLKEQRLGLAVDHLGDCRFIFLS